MRSKTYNEKQSSCDCEDENEYWILRNEIKKDLKLLVNLKIKWIYYLPFLGGLVAMNDCNKFKEKMKSRVFIEVLRYSASIFVWYSYITWISCAFIIIVPVFAIPNTFGTLNLNWAVYVLISLIMICLIVATIWICIYPVRSYKNIIKKTILDAKKKLDLKDEVQEYEEHRQKSTTEKLKIKFKQSHKNSVLEDI